MCVLEVAVLRWALAVVSPTYCEQCKRFGRHHKDGCSMFVSKAKSVTTRVCGGCAFGRGEHLRDCPRRRQQTHQRVTSSRPKTPASAPTHPHAPRPPDPPDDSQGGADQAVEAPREVRAAREIPNWCRHCSRQAGRHARHCPHKLLAPSVPAILPAGTQPIATDVQPPRLTSKASVAPAPAEGAGRLCPECSLVGTHHWKCPKRPHAKTHGLGQLPQTKRGRCSYCSMPGHAAADCELRVEHEATIAGNKPSLQLVPTVVCLRHSSNYRVAYRPELLRGLPGIACAVCKQRAVMPMVVMP